jgi:hypothetical protein
MIAAGAMAFIISIAQRFQLGLFYFAVFFAKYSIQFAFTVFITAKHPAIFP